MSPELQFLLGEINRLFDEQNAKWDARFSRRDEKREASTGAEHAAASTLTSVDMPGTFHTSYAAVAAATTSFATPGVPIVELPTTCSTPGFNGGVRILTPVPTAPSTAPMATSTQTTSPTLPVVVRLSAMDCIGVDQAVAEEAITDSSSATAAPLTMDATLSDLVIGAPTKCLREYLSTDIGVQALVYAADAPPMSPLLSFSTTSLVMPISSQQVHLSTCNRLLFEELPKSRGVAVTWNFSENLSWNNSMSVADSRSTYTVLSIVDFFGRLLVSV